MHGQRRQEYKDRFKDPKFAANLALKAQQWNTLVPQLLNHETSSQQALALTEKLLLVNPDPLVLWNKRRNILLENDEVNIQTELTLTASCLQRNPKAYGAWFHRKWILSKNPINQELLQQELQLISILLKQDERNFHGWNYRSYCVGLLLGSKDGSWPSVLTNEHETTTTTKGPQVVISSPTTTTTTSPCSIQEYTEILQDEWNFTDSKIKDNFSNYSALHYRSKLLPLLNKPLSEELEMVHNAIFTEPDDQTAWWYHRHLLKEAFRPSIQVLREEWTLLEELNDELEGQSKWTWLGIHTVLQELQTRGEQVEEEMEQCLKELIQLDPDRAGRYQSMTTNVQQA